MTPVDPTTADLRVLVAEIRDDLAAIERLAERLADVKLRAAAGSEPPPLEVMAAAGYLHHLYTGMESIHERIVTRVEGAVPSGERWHQELLTRVGVDVAGVRPAVLRPETRAQLARLLRFRHFFRHAYRIDLLWHEVAGLLADVERVVTDYRADVDAFCLHLDRAD